MPPVDDGQPTRLSNRRAVAARSAERPGPPGASEQPAWRDGSRAGVVGGVLRKRRRFRERALRRGRSPRSCWSGRGGAHRADNQIGAAPALLTERTGTAHAARSGRRRSPHVRGRVRIPVDGDPVAVGGQITYTITVGDNGPTAASGVTLTDTLPAGTTFVSAEPTSGSCSESAGTVTCTFGTISEAGAETVDIVVSAPAAPTSVTNAVAVTADEPDPDLGTTARAKRRACPRCRQISPSCRPTTQTQLRSAPT